MRRGEENGGGGGSLLIWTTFILTQHLELIRMAEN